MIGFSHTAEKLKEPVQVSLSMIFVLLFLLIFGSAWGFGQQRPGIRTIVTPPEGCWVIDQADTENLYTFLRVEIQALAFARDGAQANRDLLASREGPPIEKMGQMLAGLRQERIQNMCAGFVIAPYEQSRNEYIAYVAGNLVHYYEELGKLSDEMLRLALMETMQQKKGSSTGNELAQLKFHRQQLLGNMTDALDISLALLLGTQPGQDREGDRLLLTRAQRDDLVRYLYLQFPALKKKQGETASGDFMQQAARIRSVLS